MRVNSYVASALALTLASGVAAADSLDVNLNDKSLRADYAFTPATQRGMQIDFGHYFTEHDIYVSHAGLEVAGENWSQSGVFDIGLGGRAVYAHTEAWDATAIALGGRVRFSPVQRLGIGGSLYYAPQVITFLDGKNYLETAVQVDYQILPQAFVYAGYRVIDVDFDDKDDVKLDDRAHIGMKLMF